MRVLAFADCHGSMKAIKEVRSKAGKADIVLCCGDLTIFEQNMDRLLKELSGIGKPVLMLPGNHEPTDALKRSCGQFPHIVYMESRIFEVGDFLVFGAQGNGFAMVDRAFEAIHKDFMRLLSEKHGKKYVLMTHAPPYATELDRIVDGHCGNKSVRNFIMATKPLVAFAGHIHENAGRRGRLGETTVINPGPYGEIVTI